MSFAATRRASTEFSSINTTPLVDVMLVLLIIFMIAAPLLNHELDFTIPAKSPPHIQPVKLEPLLIEVGQSGVELTYHLDGKPTDRSALLNQLRRAAAADPKPLFILRADPSMSFEQASSAMALVRQSGLQRGSFDSAVR